MAAPETLSTPTNASPVQTDEFLGTAGAGLLRAVRVPKETGSILVTVVEVDGKTPMGFRIQGVGVDGAAVGGSRHFAAGASWTRSTALEEPAGPRIDRVAWTFLVSGDGANPTIQVMSDIAGGN